VTLRKADRLIESCEACNREEAQIPFDWILDRVTGSRPSVTDYITGTTGEVPELPARHPRKAVWMSHPAIQNDYAVVISA
jgi:hypothetical protein